MVLLLGGAWGCTYSMLAGAGRSCLPELLHTGLHRERAVDRYTLQRPRIRPRR